MKTGTYYAFCVVYGFGLFYVYEEFISPYIESFWVNYAIQTSLLVFGLLIIFLFKAYSDYKSGKLEDGDELLEERDEA